MSNVFRAVFGLWVAPDFTSVMTGKAKPPHVNHSKVDFGDLAKALRELFAYGPHVRIRVANDTVDQVTVQHRNGELSRARPPAGSIRCDDFGRALLKSATSQEGDVVDVHRAWQPLHSYADRNFAPPPVLIPFVIEAADFEDAMIWHASAKPSLGLPFLPDALQESLLQSRGNTDSTNFEGQLPKASRERMGRIFGCEYLPYALLDRLAMDAPPKEYGL
ncbi:hypothetical protein [Burkholderia sp. Ac-20365]|uniref:hypothetical protein n=1 Tax=Burkholderia sp. Ac-20365 TaxID=2703897 RepID=UPI00197BAE3B|nr:hypothetical protein [Burkholderia sp. Ac-20365]MBN3761023.1 hypothetical protein [Burkholderia sp. Ac-20365]